MNPISAATITVADLSEAVANYSEWLGYVVVEHGSFDPDLAEAIGAPTAGGLPSAVLQPASG